VPTIDVSQRSAALDAVHPTPTVAIMMPPRVLVVVKMFAGWCCSNDVPENVMVVATHSDVKSCFPMLRY
jgi:hypothetical protein